jgi:hypothetical protein
VATCVREASRACSKEEFVSKLGGTLQEANESRRSLGLLREECGIGADLIAPLEFEFAELIRFLRHDKHNKRQPIQKEKPENRTAKPEFQFSAFLIFVCPSSSFSILVV